MITVIGVIDVNGVIDGLFSDMLWSSLIHVHQAFSVNGPVLNIWGGFTATEFKFGH